MRAPIVLVLLASVANASSIDRELVKRVISTKNPAFRACYEKALQAEGPAFAGKAVLTITVVNDGTVTKVDVEFPRPSERFSTCLRDAAMDLRFPKFGGPGPIVLKWPMTFVPSP